MAHPMPPSSRTCHLQLRQIQQPESQHASKPRRVEPVGGTTSRIYDVCRGYCTFLTHLSSKDVYGKPSRYGGVVRIRKTRSQTMKQTSKLTKATARHFDTLNDPSHATERFARRRTN